MTDPAVTGTQRRRDKGTPSLRRPGSPSPGPAATWAACWRTSWPGPATRCLALARHPDTLPTGERITAVAVDVADPVATARALAGADAAYYLVHAMAGGTGFEARDRELAAAFGRAARAAGVGRIIYLGGLGRGDLSAHLVSRQEVGAVLAASGVPVVELRAAVILGAGSISYEMLRSLTERLPVMVCPRWITTRLQPLAESDLLDYLAGSLVAPAGRLRDRHA